MNRLSKGIIDVKSGVGLVGAGNSIGRSMFLCFVGCFFSAAALAQGVAQCGPLENAYGPWDYTNSNHFIERLPVVENAHFTPEVESLQGHNKCGGNGCQLAPDLDYTLRAFPNHHRALIAMVRYQTGAAVRPRPMRYTPECYFERALRFKPDDATVHMIYGYYQTKIDEPSGALSSYERALELAPDSAEAHYNAGLLYVDLEMYELAIEHAKQAYELGFPLPGLRRKLERAGKWNQEEENKS